MKARPGDEHAEGADHRDALDLVAGHRDDQEQRDNCRQTGQQPIGIKAGIRPGSRIPLNDMVATT